MSMIKQVRTKEQTDASSVKQPVSVELQLASAYDALQGKEVTIMANETPSTPSANEQSRADEMYETLKRAQSSGQFIDAMTASEQSVKPDAIKSIGKRKQTDGQGNGKASIVLANPKQFSMSHSHMGQIDSFTVNMTLPEIVDYIDYEYSIIIAEKGVGKTQLKDLGFRERFQRTLDSKRQREIADYLLRQPNHYFPPIVCVPAKVSLHDELLAHAQQANGGSASVTLAGKSILAIDGQHRKGGIEKALESLQIKLDNAETLLATAKNLPLGKEETQAQRDEEVQDKQRIRDTVSKQLNQLRSESMPVVIAALSPDDLDSRQQLFSDINRTPRKVSKSISTLYEHSDPAIVLAKYVSGMETAGTAGYGDGYSGIEWAVATEAISPKKSGKQCLTLTNVQSVIQPDKGFSKLLDCVQQGQLQPEHVGQLVQVVVDSLPLVDTLRRGGEFGKINSGFVCYNSVWWKSIGKVVDRYLTHLWQVENIRQAESEDGQRTDMADYSVVIEVVGQLMSRMNSENLFSVRNKLWMQEERELENVDFGPDAKKDKIGPVVNLSGRVENKITTVNYMSNILYRLLRETEEMQGSVDSGAELDGTSE